jgi:nicotinate phosphoribosyltransferase
MVAANDKPVAKISDEPGKSMCEDPEFLHYLASVYGIDTNTVPLING